MFEIVGASRSSAVFHWDSLGKVDYVSMSERRPHSVFSATSDVWGQVFTGEDTAVSLVITGKMKFSGPATFAFKYGVAFNEVARVANKVVAVTHVLAEE